jgi:hypothetical protein
MARSHTCYIEDEKGRPVAEAWCRAFNVSDPANPSLVEEQYSDATGAATFTALPDDAPVDILAIWGKQTKYFRNVLSNDGDDIDSAVGLSHEQNTDDYAAGVKVVTEYPASPVEGEAVIL